MKMTEAQAYKLSLTLYKNEFVYMLFNHNTGLTKIGISKDAFRRKRQIELASGCKISYLDYLRVEADVKLSAIQIEKKLNAKYAKYRKIGEWFNFPQKSNGYML